MRENINLEREALRSERKMNGEVAFQTKKIRLFTPRALSQGIHPIQLNEIASLFLHLQVVMYTFILSYPIFYMLVFHTRKKRKCVYLKTMASEVAFESVEIYVI